MSGVATGLTKVFTTVGSGIAKVGKAVTGVAASVFTGGAASGAGSLASGGLSGLASGGGTLSSLLGGAAKVASGIFGAATGSPGMGALVDAAGSALSGATTPAATATGFAATGTTGGGFGSIFNGETLGGLVGGLGEGWMEAEKIKAIEAEKQRDRDFEQKKIDDIRNSYAVDPSVYSSAPATTAIDAPTPDKRFGKRLQWDPGMGRIINVEA